MTGKSLPSQRGDQTRDALIATAIQVFARDGFHAVSTREIAQAAQVNQALISYHFGNKEGLYMAAFRFITGQINQRIGPIADAIDRALDEQPGPPGAAGQPGDDLAMLLRLTDGMTDLVLNEPQSNWVQLVMREQQAPTEAFTVFYDGVMGRLLSLLTRLVERITGISGDERARLVVVALLGQLMVWRVARAGVLRHMQWPRIGPAQIARIKLQTRANVIALLGLQETR